MRKQGKNNVKIARKTARGPMKAMVSPSILKVNLSHLAYFDTPRDRNVWSFPSKCHLAVSREVWGNNLLIGTGLCDFGLSFLSILVMQILGPEICRKWECDGSPGRITQRFVP
jgi:hypothetical protein